MVHFPTGNSEGADELDDPALQEVARLRREVEIQERRVQLLQQRKQQRDALLLELRGTLERTQPQGFREISNAAEEILAELNGDLGDPTTRADAVSDDVHVVFNPRAQQAPPVEEETAGPQGVKSIDDYLQQEEEDERRAQLKKKRKKDRKQRGKIGRAKRNRGGTNGERPTAGMQHADPCVAPAGFDASKARSINQRKAEEEEAHKARLYAMLDDLVKQQGPLLATSMPQDADGEPAWLADTEEAAQASGEACKPSRVSVETKEKVTAPPHTEADPEYPDDFEDDDDDDES